MESDTLLGKLALAQKIALPLGWTGIALRGAEWAAFPLEASGGSLGDMRRSTERQATGCNWVKARGERRRSRLLPAPRHIAPISKSNLAWVEFRTAVPWARCAFDPEESRLNS
jgi:hypothetical protein